jgi:hypothetical protein
LRRIAGIFAGAFITLTIFCSKVYAHIPVFSSNIDSLSRAVFIEDPLVSHTIYGKLDEEGQVDYVKFNASKGDILYVEMTLPAIGGNEGFKPSFAVIGRGLPNTRVKTDFTLPDTYGFALFNSGYDNEKLYEPYTQTSYIRRQNVRMVAPASGEYYIAIFSPENSSGKYCLNIGYKDKMNFLDVVMLPYSWYRVKYWFSPMRAIFTAVVLSAIIMGIIYYVRNKKVKRADV